MSRRTSVILRDTPPSLTAPTDTGVGFLVSIPFKGALNAARPARSFAEWITLHGDRQTYSVAYDWAELFFREGGRTLYTSPVRGPAAAQATLNLTGTSGTTLVVKGKSAGDWANGATGGLSVEVQNGPSGGTTRILIIRLNGVEVERTPEYTTQAAFIAWSDTSNYVTITAGGGTASLPIVAASANLASGTLDVGSITQTQIDAAIDLISGDLGPGQIAAPDWQTTTTHTKLLAHAAARNRFALLDTTDTAVEATVSSLSNTIQGNTNGMYGALTTPWVVIQGTSGGASRYVPASAFVAAKCNQVDGTAGANQAPAGEFGRQTSSLVTGLRATYSDTSAAALEAVGANLLISRRGEVRMDGNRTLVEPGGTDAEWLQIGNSRERMAVVAEIQGEGEGFEHRQITPVTISQLDTAATGVMMRHESRYFPEDDDPGWVVDTGDAVNTDALIAAGQLTVAIGFRPGPGADLVVFYLTKVGVGQPIA